MCMFAQKKNKTLFKLSDLINDLVCGMAIGCHLCGKSVRNMEFKNKPILEFIRKLNNLV